MSLTAVCRLKTLRGCALRLRPEVSPAQVSAQVLTGRSRAREQPGELEALTIMFRLESLPVRIQVENNYRSCHLHAALTLITDREPRPRPTAAHAQLCYEE